MRDGLPRGAPADRRRLVRHVRRRRSPRWRCSRASSSCATRRSATPRRCSPRSCSGPSSATSTAAATTRSTSAFAARAAAARGVAVPRALRPLALVRRAAAAHAPGGAWRRSCPALWFLPEWWGSGDPFRAGARANNPNPGSAAFAEHPALELISRFRKVVIAPVKVGIIIGVVYALVHVGAAPARGRDAGGRRRRLRLVRARRRHDRGRLRGQPALPDRGHRAASACSAAIGAARVLQGVGWLGARRSRHERAGALTAAAAFFVLAWRSCSPFIIEKADNTGSVSGGLRHEAQLWHDLKGLIDEAGGRERARGLRRRVQRALPDADGGLRAARPRDPGGVERDAPRRAWRSAPGRCPTARS